MNIDLSGKYWYRKLLAVLIIAVVITMVITAFESNIISTFLIRWAGQWATTLGAIFAVLIVFVAFLSIRNASIQAKLGRDQDAEKELRDRKERLLGRIIDWTTNVLKINSDLWDAFAYHDFDIQLNRLPIVNIKSNVQALRDEGKSIIVISVEAGEGVTEAANTIWNELTTITNVLNALCVITAFDDDATTSAIIDSQPVDISKHNAPVIIEEHRKELAVPCNLIIDKSTQAIVLLSK